MGTWQPAKVNPTQVHSTPHAWREQPGVLPVPPNWMMLAAVNLGQKDVGVVQLGTPQLSFSQVWPGDSKELPGLDKVLGKYRQLK